MLVRIIFFVLLFFSSLTVRSQNKVDSLKSFDEVWGIGSIVKDPEFPGGSSAYKKFILQNMVIPKEVKSAKIKDKVIISFVVLYDGSLDSISVVKGGDSCPSCKTINN